MSALDQLANDELGVPVSRLAVAWALAHPAVNVAIIGTRDAEVPVDAEISAHGNGLPGQGAPLGDRNTPAGYSR